MKSYQKRVIEDPIKAIKIKSTIGRNSQGDVTAVHAAYSYDLFDENDIFIKNVIGREVREFDKFTKDFYYIEKTNGNQEFLSISQFQQHYVEIEDEPKPPINTETIEVNADALFTLLEAVVGEPHQIRDLRVSSGPTAYKVNPINVLFEQYNKWANETNAKQKLTKN